MSSRCPDGQPTPVSPSFPARRSLDRCVRSGRTHRLRLERCERCPWRIDTERKRPKVVAKLLVAAAAWLTSSFLLRLRNSSTHTFVTNDCSLQIQPTVTFPQARRTSHTVDIDPGASPPAGFVSESAVSPTLIKLAAVPSAVSAGGGEDHAAPGGRRRHGPGAAPLCAVRRCQLLRHLLRVWHLLFRVSRADCTVLSDDVPAAAGRASIPAQHLTPHAASILNLALVSSDALYQTAEAIQACLVDVLRDASLLQEASEQQNRRSARQARRI